MYAHQKYSTTYRVNTNLMKSYQVLAQMLRDYGITTMFGLLGDGNMYVSAAFEEIGGRLVRVTHEAGAVAMADAYARMTGGPGVATVTHGPGFTNAITALLEAQRFPSPVLLITGNTPSEATHMQRLDMAAACAAMGIDHDYIYKPESLPRDVNRILRKLKSGPVVLNLPLRIARTETTEKGRIRIPSPLQPAIIEPSLLDNALGLIASASRPVIVGGRGVVVSGAERAITELADILGAPLLTTGLGHGLFRGHPRNLGIMGTLTAEPVVEVLSKSDCIVAFGATLNKYTTLGGDLFKTKRLIQVDINPEKLGWLVEPDQAITGDAGNVATQMYEQLREAGYEPSESWGQLIDQVAVSLENWDPGDLSNDFSVDIRAATKELNKIIPNDCIIVSDVGRFVAGVWPFLNRFLPGFFTAMTGFGAIGLGLAAGTGAAIARPHDPIVVLCGDGGFMMNISELATSVRESLSMLILVYNDSAYGAEYMKLIDEGLDPAACYNQWPNIADIARGFGAIAYTVSSLNDIRSLPPLRLNEGPIVIDIHVDPTNHIDF